LPSKITSTISKSLADWSSIMALPPYLIRKYAIGNVSLL
jgi:hypothetical protein